MVSKWVGRTTDFLMVLVAALFLAFAIDYRFGSQEWFLRFLSEIQVSAGPLGVFAGALLLHVTAADPIGVSAVSFASRLFFLPLPLEPYIAYAYGVGANPLLLPLLVAFFGTAGAAVNYLTGVMLHERILKDGKAEKFAEKVKGSRFAAPAIFAAALLPVPDITGLVFGALRVGRRRFVVYTFAGLFLKVLIIMAAFDYVNPYVQALI